MTGNAFTRLCAPRYVSKPAGINPPTAGCLDSQRVKTTHSPGERGYDAGKQVNGRNRHLLVDTLGLLLVIVVTAASVSDSAGARLVLQRLRGIGKKLRLPDLGRWKRSRAVADLGRRPVSVYSTDHKVALVTSDGKGIEHRLGSGTMLKTVLLEITLHGGVGVSIVGRAHRRESA